MASVTHRAKTVKQPYGGYLPSNFFTKDVLNDGLTLNEKENINAGLVGMTVDYLTRFTLGDSVDKAFNISCLGASILKMTKIAEMLKSKITGLDNISITAACKLTGFDVCYRSSPAAYKPIEEINPDTETIENIRIMVERSVAFWKKYGPIVCSEPTFDGGYTETVNAGDGDFLSNDTLWDFKATKTAPTSINRLQLLMYYVMGLHSIHNEFKNIKYLGIFNPRMNIAYICPINRISNELITEIENTVICYGNQSSSVKSTSLKSKEKIDYEYTIKDISDKTGRKKNLIYSDIRSGRLSAYKKGNKYYISQSDYLEYIHYLKKIKTLEIITIITMLSISIGIILYTFIKL